MKVALVASPSLFLLQPYTFPPLGIMYLAASAKKCGYEVDVIDLTGEEDYLEKTSNFSAYDVIAISATTPQFHYAVEMLNVLRRKQPKATIIIGGAHPSVEPNSCIRVGFDAAVVGEAEIEFPLILSRLENGWKPKGEIIHAQMPMDLDALPFPDRDCIKLHKYQYIIDGLRATSIITQRGCSYECLPSGTKITLIDGSKKPIENIREGDVLWTYDESLHKCPSRVIKVHSRVVPANELVKMWITRKGKLSKAPRETRLYLTLNHPIYVKNKGWIHASLIQPGDHVLKVWKTGLPTGYSNPAAREYMLKNNPMKKPEVAAKCAESLRKMYKEHPEIIAKIVSKGQYTRLHKQGGLSRGQKLLFEIVKACTDEDVEVEFPVLRYLCDVAIPRLKIDFEYDGHSKHWRNRDCIEHDKKRDDALRKEGWLVVRVGNREIWDVHNVMKKISRAIGLRHENNSAFKLVRQVYRMKDKNRKVKVYNLSVEPAHTFVANGILVHNCAFCSHGPGYKKVRFRSPDNVVEEIKHIKEQYGISAFMFWDDEFNLNQRRTVELCEALKSLNIKFRCFIRSNLFNVKIAKVMREAGCVEVGCGVESGSDKILQIINKRTTVKQNTLARRICREVGIRFKAFTILGLPSETRETAHATLNWLIDNQPDDADITIFMPYPGSKIWRNYKEYDIKFDKAEIAQNLFQTSFYKGAPRSLVSTSQLSSEEIVQLRDEFEDKIGRKYKARWLWERNVFKKE